MAYLALTKAARRFDPESGHDFLSFCVPTIRGEVRRYFRDKGWMVRPPRRIQELQQRITQAQRDLSSSMDGPPAPTSSRTTSTSGRDVREALDSHGCFTPTSLDRPVGDDLGSSLVSSSGTRTTASRPRRHGSCSRPSYAD